MAKTAKLSLLCDCKCKVVSRQRYGERLGVAIGGAKGNEEVEDVSLKGREEGVDGTTKCVMWGDEELPDSGFLLTAERRATIELEGCGPILFQTWGPAVGQRPKLDGMRLRVVPVEIVIDEGAGKDRCELGFWDQFGHFVVSMGSNNQVVVIQLEIDLEETKGI